MSVQTPNMSRDAELWVKQRIVYYRIYTSRQNVLLLFIYHSSSSHDKLTGCVVDVRTSVALP